MLRIRAASRDPERYRHDCTKHDSTCSLGYDNFPYYSDANHPAVFWIMNGMNDFEYNMAAGAATCGTCYWFVPGAISGLSQTEKWYGYAGEQLGSQPGTLPPFSDRGGTTPLESFVGNSCSSAMEAFMEIGDSAVCNGVNQMDPANLTSKVSTLQMLPSTQATQNFPVPIRGRPLLAEGVRRRASGHALRGRRYGQDQPRLHLGPDLQRWNQGKLRRGRARPIVTNFNWAENNFSAIWVSPFGRW